MLGRKNVPNMKGSQENSLVDSYPMHNSDVDDILSITGVDKASKLVASITLDQMVKVMKNLALKKRRSTPLLNSLSLNLSGKDEKLNLKQCSDILYAMASLNYSDVNLTSKICNDIQASLKTSDIRKSSIIGSMLKSLAILKGENFVQGQGTSNFTKVGSVLILIS